MNFIDQFKAAHRVSTPLVAVRTFDAKSTIERIRNVFGDNQPAIIVWDCVRGMNAITPAAKIVLEKIFTTLGITQGITADVSESLNVCSVLPDDCIVFLSNSHLQLDGQSRVNVIQGTWNLRDYFKAKGSMLILLTSSGCILPSELANDFLVLDEPLPTHAELGAIVRDTFKFAKQSDKCTDAIVVEACKALIGLPAFPAEQSAAMCLDTDTGILDMSGLWERKRQSINQTRGLTVLQTSAKLEEIGGLEQFKTYLERVMTSKHSPNVILIWDEIEKSFAGMGTDTSGTTTKMGGNVLSWSQDTGMLELIAVGVPGAGKSEIAKAVANKYGKLCIGFNLADMESGIVGSSNEYLRQAQAVIDAVSDGKVLSLATSNNIESLPAEIQRRFATEGIFFFDSPTAIERECIWKIYRAKFDIPESDTVPVDSGWTGAEIKNCASKASRLGISLVDASNYIVPVAVSNAAKLDALRRNCSGKYLSASYPGTYTYNGDTQESLPEPTGRKMR